MSKNFVSYINNNLNVNNGQARKATSAAISITRRMTKRDKSKTTIKLFIITPRAIAISTFPCLYSFFRGLKKVRISIGKENKPRNAPLKETKYLIKPLGASKNQKTIQLKRKVRIGIYYKFIVTQR